MQLLPPQGEDESRPSARLAAIKSLGDRIVCERCGEVGAEVRPDWDSQLSSKASPGQTQSGGRPGRFPTTSIASKADDLEAAVRGKNLLVAAPVRRFRPRWRTQRVERSRTGLAEGLELI
jgi:hypothetical protein